MKRYGLVFGLLALFNVGAFAQDDDETANELIGMMVVAKATGMCGVFSQMVTFQQTTKMQGGDEFIVRFLSTEAARLGKKDMEELYGQCPSVIEKYQSYMTLLGFNQ